MTAVKPNLRSRLFYGLLAPVYEKFVISSSRYRDSITKFVEGLSIDGDKRILEAGCGTGIVSFALTRQEKVKVTAFDVSERMLETAKKSLMEHKWLDYILYHKRNGHNVEFYKGNIEDPRELRSLDGRVMQLEENSFDYVIVSGALEYVNLENGINELVKYLRPEGSLINIGIRDNLYGKALGKVMGFKPYSRERIANAFEGAGLATIRELPINSKKLKRLRIAIKGIKI